MGRQKRENLSRLVMNVGAAASRIGAVSASLLGEDMQKRPALPAAPLVTKNVVGTFHVPLQFHRTGKSQNVVAGPALDTVLRHDLSRNHRTTLGDQHNVRVVRFHGRC